MKKLFTIDDFMVAFIAALGYGFGENIAKLLGWPALAGVAASFVLGIALEEIIGAVIFSQSVQKKPVYRVITFVTILSIVVAAQFISVRFMGVSMLEYIVEESEYVIVLPVIGFVVNLLIRAYHIWKIRRLYGDGSKGYVFEVTKEDIEETNRQNQPILGEYDKDCAVKTRTGIYVGEKQDEIINFYGIPYAKPPVGSLRWKAPEPLPSSEAVFEAVNFGASAIQVEHSGSIVKYHRQSEDCLYLNICTGAEKSGAKKAVLVLFHNLDFSSGGTVDPLLYGDNLVRNNPDIVFVSFNYRLGIFGFIDFTEIPGGEVCPDAVNLGLRDQVAALQWIKENIAAFGGDPDRITVAGFESGATSICLLAASGQARELFKKAFIFNGSPADVYDSPEASRALAKNLLKETGTSTMEELMQLNTQSLKEAAQKLWKDMCAPTCDGTWIPSDVYAACREGAASGIRFIIGAAHREMQVNRSFIGDRKFEDLLSATAVDMKRELDPSFAKAIQEYMKAQTDASTVLEAGSKLAGQWNTLCIYRFAVSLSAGGNNVHFMYWDEEPVIEKLGSGSVDAAASLLGNDEALQMYGSVMSEDLSSVLQLLLVKFIKGNALQLYQNEITGVDAFDWKAFPKALIVSDGSLQCGAIEDRLTEVFNPDTENSV